MENDRVLHPGEIYRHFKDKLYQIVAVAYHSETKEKMVVYQALYDDFKVYVRPYDMFLSEVDHKKYPQVTEKYRFTKVIPDTGEASFENDLPKQTDYEGVNPILLAFFEKESSNEKIEYLLEVRDKLDERLVSDMAVSMDFTIEESSLDEKIDSLLQCLKTRAKFECSRFR